MLSGWGILISFWSVLVFSSAFFQYFFLGTVCLSSFVFPGAFLVFFSRKNWHFAVALCCCPTRLRRPICPWLFKFFQYASYASYAPQPVGGLASGSFDVGSSFF